MEIAQALKVKVGSIHYKVGSIHYIEGSGFGDEQVKDIDIMQLAVRNMNKCGDIATQVKQGMKFYG